MKLPVEVFGDTVVVHTPEELATDQADGFLTFMSSLPQNLVVLDLDNTENFDSAGLTAMCDLADRLRELGGDVKFATNNLMNRKILEITRLDQQFEIFESVVDAVKSFR
jgi:anti-sigma B factor antagonist